MKTYYYDGPGGRTEMPPPLPARMAGASWFLVICTLGFIGWGAYYLYLADPSVYLGRHLSPGHDSLESNCAACHQPFTGVPNSSCTAPDCHIEIETKTIHNTRDRKCAECHPVHTGGELVNTSLPDEECDRCHRRLMEDPGSVFHPDNRNLRAVTYVPRSIFRHRSHQFPPHYRCWQCHCTGDETLDVPMRDLFKMDSCLKCHEREGCGVCHAYHQQRKPRPRDMRCIRRQFVSELQYKTLGCTEYRGRRPGFNDLVVCGTDQPAITYGRKALLGGDTAGK